MTQPESDAPSAGKVSTHWTRSAREQLLPRRGGQYLPSPKRPDPRESFRQQVASYDKRIWQMLERLLSVPWPAAQTKELVEAVSLIESDAAAHFLAGLAGERSVRKQLVAYFSRFPSRGFLCLAPRVRSVRKEDELTGLLRRQSREFPRARSARPARLGDPQARRRDGEAVLLLGTTAKHEKGRGDPRTTS